MKFGSRAYGAYKFEVMSTIKEFIGLSPKNYSVIAEDPSENLVKIRGFTLTNPKAQKAINATKMRELLFDFYRHQKEKFIEIDNFSMKKDRRGPTVRSTVLTKKYRNNGFSKRWIPPLEKNSKNDVADPIVSYPYGLVHFNFRDLPESSL